MFNPYVQDWNPTVNDLPLERKHEERDKHKSAIVSCLRQIHGVFTVADAVSCGHNEFTGAAVGRHRPRINCGCHRCRSDRALGCPHPNKCQEHVSKLVAAIGAKWSPSLAPPDTSGNLTEEELAENEHALAIHEPVVFDPTTSSPDETQDAFRAFTNTLCVEPNGEAALEPGAHESFIKDGPELVLTACGAAVHANTARAKSGYAMEWQSTGQRKIGTNDGPQTKVRAATIAILEAARIAPKDQVYHEGQARTAGVDGVCRRR